MEQTMMSREMTQTFGNLFNQSVTNSLSGTQEGFGRNKFSAVSKSLLDQSQEAYGLG